MVHVKVNWDVDSEEDLQSLPNVVAIPNDIEEDDIADYLSDEYGFCVNSFYYE